MSAPEIATRIHGGLPQVSKVVREINEATKPTSVPLALGDAKTTCPVKVWDLLAAAAKRRGLDPAHLALAIMEGVLKRGSVDAAIAPMLPNTSPLPTCAISESFKSSSTLRP
jgi:hypothetical protein